MDSPPGRTLFLIAAAFAACSLDGSSGLPPGDNQESTRTFDVDFQHPLAPVLSLGGIDGSVPRSSPSEIGWAEHYQQHGVEYARIPRGSKCGITLDAVCPDPGVELGGEPLCTYGFEALDRTVRDLYQMGIHTIWQAMFDVGVGACEARDGIEVATRTVGDPEVWPGVVSQVLSHLRSLGILPSEVEFLPDATGVGGYDVSQFIQLFNLYDAFIDRLRGDFPRDGDGVSAFRILAPSLAVAHPDEFDDPETGVRGFIDHVAGQTARMPDLLSLVTISESPRERLAIWEAARERLDKAGMSSVGLADLGPRIGETTWESLAEQLDTRSARSAFLGARLTASRILAQGVLDLMVADRWAGPRESADSVAGEDLFLADGGTALPALNVMMPLYLMASRDAVRVDTVLRDGIGPSDGNGFAVLAARIGEKGAAVLVAASEASRVGQRMTYQLQVSGIPDWVQRVTVRKAVVARNTKSFGFNEVTEVEVGKNGLFLTRDIDVPSVHYIELDFLTGDRGEESG